MSEKQKKGIQKDVANGYLLQFESAFPAITKLGPPTSNVQRLFQNFVSQNIFNSMTHKSQNSSWKVNHWLQRNHGESCWNKTRLYFRIILHPFLFDELPLWTKSSSIIDFLGDKRNIVRNPILLAEYSRKTLLESLLSMRWILLGYSFEPRPNSRALGTADLVINKRMLALEK